VETTTETTSLIAGSKVTGTNVYDTKGESIGSIYDIMLDKKSGKVVYAVMSFGGFLGMGNDYHPLPWSMLKYDTGVGGYVVGLSKDKLQGSPHYAAGADPGWGNRDYETKLHSYYGVGPYWGE
jgi:sporulation protein YlmC with PRC-barrel domain